MALTEVVINNNNHLVLYKRTCPQQLCEMVRILKHSKPDKCLRDAVVSKSSQHIDVFKCSYPSAPTARPDVSHKNLGSLVNSHYKSIKKHTKCFINFIISTVKTERQIVSAVQELTAPTYAQTVKD